MENPNPQEPQEPQEPEEEPQPVTTRETVTAEREQTVQPQKPAEN